MSMESTLGCIEAVERSESLIKLPLNQLVKPFQRPATSDTLAQTAPPPIAREIHKFLAFLYMFL